jgi:membrane associated rhomboid family serine protease
MTTSESQYYNQQNFELAESGGRRKWFNINNPKTQKNYGTNSSTNNHQGDDDYEDDEEIYVVKQRYGVLSIFFSLVQTIVLAIMMIQCGVAPLKINPMIGPYPDALSEWGAKNTVFILEDGEWWRLITPIFLHAGIIHLLCNIMVQLETGAFFEREWGSIPWLIIYLASAVGSSSLSVVAMPDAISVGSSGAVMGLFGGKGAEVICRCCESNNTDQDHVAYQVRKEQCAGVMCSVTVVMLFSFIPYVDWAAHLGGLLAGFCVGMILFAIDLKKACISKLIWLLVGVGLTGVFFALLLQHMYSGNVEAAEELRDVCGYYKQNFEEYQCNCQREVNQR